MPACAAPLPPEPVCLSVALTPASTQFKEDFIKQGVDGGKKAAYALRSAILAECGVHASGLEVIAKVYANLAGLCRAMRRDGCLDSETLLKDFTLGFTQAKASFDFVDVGHGKERADNKVKGMPRRRLRAGDGANARAPETTKWHLNNSNCKQVILGISHDAGYAPFLDELFQDPPVRVRVTVLEGIPTVRELSSTGVNILNLNHNLFRSEKLVGRALLDSSVESVVSDAGPRTASVTSGSTSTPATSAASTPAPAPATTYARVIKNGTPPPVLTFPIQAKSASSGRQQPAPKPAPW